MDFGTQPMPASTPPPLPNVGYTPAPMEEPRASGARNAVAGLLLFFAAWATVSGVAGLWFRSTILDAEGFASRTAALIATPEIRSSLTDSISTPMLDNTSDAEKVRGQVEEATGLALDTDEVLALLQTQVVEVHHAIFDAEAGSGPITINLSGMLEPVREKVKETAPNVRLPEEVDRLEEVEILPASVLTQVASGVSKLRLLLLLIPIAAIIAFVAGIAASPRRLRALTAYGIQVAIYAAVLLVTVFAGSSAFDALAGETGSGVDVVSAAYGVFTVGLRTWMMLLVVFGAIVAIGSYVARRVTAP